MRAKSASLRRVAPIRWLRVAVTATLLAFATGAGTAPEPTSAGSECNPGFHCGYIDLVGAGLGEGTVVGHGITCTIVSGAENGDCQQLYQFEAEYLLVDLTITAAIGSTYVTATGGTALEGQPVVEAVYIPGDGGTGPKDVRFNLAWQEIELVVAGPGTGVIYHTESGVKCPPQCTLRYFYGEAGIHVAASPIDATSTFKSWDGPCAGQGPICEFTMPKSTTMTATFVLKPASTPTARPPTARPPTAAPSLAASPGATPTASESAATLPADSLVPESAVPASASASASGAALTPAASVPPTSPVSSDSQFGPGLLVGLLVAGAILGVGGFLLWRRQRLPAA